MTTITVTFPENYANYGEDGVDEIVTTNGWKTQSGNVYIANTSWQLPDLTIGTPSSAETVKTAIDALSIDGVTTTIE